MTSLLPLLQAATDVARDYPYAPSRDLALYLADAAALGAFGFAWRTSARLMRIETILTERGTGVVDNVEQARKSIHRHGNDLQGHEARLDGHDRELERLDRDKEPRRALGPREVGIPDRRSSI